MSPWNRRNFNSIFLEQTHNKENFSEMPHDIIAVIGRDKIENQAKTGSKTSPKMGPFSEPCFFEVWASGDRSKTSWGALSTNFEKK